MQRTSPYYFNIDLFYDNNKLYKIYKKIKNNTYYTYDKGLACLTIIPIKNYQEVLNKILCKFKNPNIITDAAFLHNTEHGILKPHIDETRFCAINIPITITDSCLQFFECESYDYAIQTVNNGKNSINREGGKVCKNCTLINEVYYTTPICFDASKPHGVKNNSNAERITLSLDITTELTFNDLLKLYNDNLLLW